MRTSQVLHRIPPSRRLYSQNISLENCENIQKELDRIQDQFLKQKDPITNLSLPRKGLEMHSIQKLLTMVGRYRPCLPACGAVNQEASFTTTKIFLKPDLKALKALETSLNTKGQLWGYQMQNIPLNDEKNIEELSRHILEIYQKNTVVLTLSENAKTLFRPKQDPLITERTFHCNGIRAFEEPEL